MASKRNVYLDLKSIQDVTQILFDRFGSIHTPTELVDVVHSKSRVLSQPAMAALSSPNFHAAAMDGIAVAAKDTFGANEDRPVTLVTDETAFWVNTGHRLPEGTDAVIMIEHVNIIDKSQVQIEAPAVPWQYVRKMGEDIVATQLLFARGHQINSYSLGALLSGGVFKADVFKQPNVLLIPTGSELIPWDEVSNDTLEPGKVVESNSAVLGGLCEDYGAVFECHPMLKDDVKTIQTAVETAAQKKNNQKQYDLICIIGGSSAGSEDFARPVVENAGEVLVHGVTMMPGKPVLIGSVADTPVFGIPGYPVSAIMAFELFVGPLLLNMQKLPLKEDVVAKVLPARKMTSKLGQDEFVRVKIGSVDGKLISSQLPRGSGSITTITEADGIIKIAKNVEGVSEKQETMARLLKPRKAIENTLVIIGSHDNTLDLLADEIKSTDGQVSISSSHVGSMGGLMAIKKRTCHIAGTHLLDPTDGTYNRSYIKKYLSNEKVWLINLVMRDQGLILPKGNPENIKSIKDLTENQLKFINRQPGSGTRVLFDYQLNELGISPDEINGYATDEYTHMSVAVAVLSGRADAGLGIMAAAKALDLDFIPIVTESYDLVIPDRFYTTPMVQVLLDTINTKTFQTRVNQLGGYSTQQTGQIILSA